MLKGIQAAKAFAAADGAKWPKAVAKVTGDLGVLVAFYNFPGEPWIHLSGRAAIALVVICQGAAARRGAAP